MTNGGPVYRVSLGGDSANAPMIGCVAPANGAKSALRVLEILAQRGRSARARDIIDVEGSAAFLPAVADFLIGASISCALPCPGEVITNHELLDGSLACGVGLAFGHADASLLQDLVGTADAVGARALACAPDRALIAVGVSRDAASEFGAAAERLGFIIRGDDPRCRVIACAGAPFCASGHIAARTIAPLIAKTAALPPDSSVAVHVSGCAKGCANPAPARLTIVGTAAGCALVANGTARDTPFTVVPIEQLAQAISEGRHV
jgi:precorrin-3B synthase